MAIGPSDKCLRKLGEAALRKNWYFYYFASLSGLFDAFSFWMLLYTIFLGLLDSHIVLIISQARFPYFKYSECSFCYVVSVISTLINMLTHSIAKEL